MPTSATGTTAYALNADFVERFDPRSAGQLLVDTTTPLTAAQVLTSTRLLTLLKGASGEVEAACLVSEKYVIDPLSVPPRNDLADLTGNSAEYLKDLVCTLAAERLFSRRPELLAQIGERVKAAREALQLLRDGQRVFGWLENQQAGIEDHYRETAQNTLAIRGINVLAERLFGARGWRRREQTWGNNGEIGPPFR